MTMHIMRAPLHRRAREHLVIQPLPTELDVPLAHGEARLVPLLYGLVGVMTRGDD